MKWKENVLFDEQKKITLADDEVDAIEQYIDNSAPEHVNLNNQYSENLVNMCNNYCAEQVSTYGFTDVIECISCWSRRFKSSIKIRCKKSVRILRCSFGMFM